MPRLETLCVASRYINKIKMLIKYMPKKDLR